MVAAARIEDQDLPIGAEGPGKFDLAVGRSCHLGTGPRVRSYRPGSCRRTRPARRSCRTIWPLRGIIEAACAWHRKGCSRLSAGMPPGMALLLPAPVAVLALDARVPRRATQKLLQGLGLGGEARRALAFGFEVGGGLRSPAASSAWTSCQFLVRRARRSRLSRMFLALTSALRTDIGAQAVRAGRA